MNLERLRVLLVVAMVASDVRASDLPVGIQSRVGRLHCGDSLSFYF